LVLIVEQEAADEQDSVKPKQVANGTSSEDDTLDTDPSSQTDKIEGKYEKIRKEEDKQPINNVGPFLLDVNNTQLHLCATKITK